MVLRNFQSPDGGWWVGGGGGGGGGGRWCWANFQCRGVLLICIVVGQKPTALAVGAGGVVLDIFFSRLSFLSPSFWETAQWRFKTV